MRLWWHSHPRHLFKPETHYTGQIILRDDGMLMATTWTEPRYYCPDCKTTYVLDRPEWSSSYEETGTKIDISQLPKHNWSIKYDSK